MQTGALQLTCMAYGMYTMCMGHISNREQPTSTRELSDFAHTFVLAAVGLSSRCKATCRGLATKFGPWHVDAPYADSHLALYCTMRTNS